MRRSDQEVSRLADGVSRMARTNPRTGAWLNAIAAFHHELMSASRSEALHALWPAIAARRLTDLRRPVILIPWRNQTYATRF